MPQFTKRMRNLVRATACRMSPSLANDVRLAQYLKKWVLPRDTGTNEKFVPSHMLGHAGFDLHVEDQLARISRWTDPRYQQLFRALREDPEINTGLNGQSFGTAALHNGYYPTPDAEIYAAMILDIRPKHVIEVGSGFSTLVARHAIRFGNTGSTLTVIDPEPRTNVSAAADEVIRAFVEDTESDRSHVGLEHHSVHRFQSHLSEPGGCAAFVLQGAPEAAGGHGRARPRHLHPVRIPDQLRRALLHRAAFAPLFVVWLAALSDSTVDAQSVSKSRFTNAACVRGESWTRTNLLWRIVLD